jgi:transposase
MLNREDWIMIKQMRERGCYFEDIARELGVSSKTISRALHREGAPRRRKQGVGRSKLDAYKAEIDRLLGENIWNAEVIYAHVREQGYAGSKTILREDSSQAFVAQACGHGSLLDGARGAVATRLGRAPKGLHRG